MINFLYPHKNCVVTSRQKRASRDDSQTKSFQNASQIKQLIREELACCKTKSVLRMKPSAAQDQEVKRDDGEDPEPEGDQVPKGTQGQKDLLVNMDQ